MPAAVQVRFRSNASIDDLREALSGHTAPQEGGFTLMHRLSGAGVVVRTLKAPETERALFGTVEDSGFSVAFVPSQRDVTPFHPIIRGQLVPHANGGTMVTAELAHHPDARTWAPLYAFGAVVLGIGSVLRFGDQPALMWSGLGLALLFAVFPTLQARVRFGGACQAAAGRLAELLKLERQP